MKKKGIALLLGMGMVLTGMAGSLAEGTVFYQAEDLFKKRDLRQEADLTDARTLTLSEGTDVHITEKGVYVVQGSAKEATIYVEASNDAKVQLVLDGISMTNTSAPCIYVTGGGKAYVTLVGENSMNVIGSFSFQPDPKADGVIFSRSDLVLNGTGSLSVNSPENGIVGKDDVKITGGSYTVTAGQIGFRANDAIMIADGVFQVKAGTDAFHADNDDTKDPAYVYIGGGIFDLEMDDDGIHTNGVIQIDGGTLTIDGWEGLEATYVQINGGTLAITASDDGINAGKKAKNMKPAVEINGGVITIVVREGDTDGIDANGDIIIRGGTVNITGDSPMDYDGTFTWTGGTIIINGEEKK